MADQTAQPAPAQETQKLVVPTDLWKQISTAVGSFAWNEVRNLRQAVHSAFGEAGVDVANTVATPPHMPVSVELFNAASTFLGSKPHDAVDAVMTNIASFITLVQQHSAAEFTKAKEAVEAVIDPTPAVAATPVTETPAPVVEAPATPVTEVTDVVYTETAPTAAAPAAPAA